jgi:NADPH-dependent curcumin reductase CurA
VRPSPPLTQFFQWKYLLFFLSIFVSTDFESEFPAAIKELTVKLRKGSLKRKFHIVEGGITQAPVALPMLFNGGNTGKL